MKFCLFFFLCFFFNYTYSGVPYPEIKLTCPNSLMSENDKNRDFPIFIVLLSGPLFLLRKWWILPYLPKVKVANTYNIYEQIHMYIYIYTRVHTHNHTLKGK